MFIKNIDSISSGLSIWSNNSTEDLAHGFVRGYVSKYEEAIKFCEETLEYYETKGKHDSYMRHWKRYDQYNEHIREFYLTYKPLNLEDFNRDELLDAIKSMDKLIEVVDNFNKDNNNKI
jgi:hypothetical protein